jgi:hypothetical protein
MIVHLSANPEDLNPAQRRGQEYIGRQIRERRATSLLLPLAWTNRTRQEKKEFFRNLKADVEWAEREWENNA